MIQDLKSLVRLPIIWNRHRSYEARVKAQTVPYEVWVEGLIKSQREERNKEISEMNLSKENLEQKVRVLRYDMIVLSDAFETLQGIEEEYVLFAECPALLTEDAAAFTALYFEKNRDIQIAYADETGWFKPAWSPDLFLSCFYFGNVFAVRTELLKSVLETWKKKTSDFAERDYRIFLYELAMCLVDHVGSAGQMTDILYREWKEEYWGAEERFACVKQGRFFSDPAILPDGKDGLVSIIIPSKDNPGMLSRSIHTVLENTDYPNFEIIVVDNGSSEENKARIEKMREQLKEAYHFQYHYQKMEFNFSKMCNWGAGLAKGNYLLFLNDDIEIMQSDWLSRMVSKAKKEYVGAVGVKLLYPTTDIIQHVGVTNIHLGPAHELQFQGDRGSYNHGYNRLVVNVTGVTGACMLMRKEVFDEIQGWNEKLAVAFNDVELCFRINECGYKNVCLNNVALCHHESVSRGADEGRKKISRLHDELETLYRLHPDMWNRDLYKSKKFVTDTLDKGFQPACRFSEARCSEKSTPVPMEAPKEEWYNECLLAAVEFAGDRRHWETGVSGGGDYYIQGFSYAVNVDNSRYNKSLILKSVEEPEKFWRVSYTEGYRPDQEDRLAFIDHPALTGVSVWLPEGSLPKGDYLIGYLWKDSCSRQRLCRFTAEILSV